MLNQIVLMGNLVRDPELRRTGTGTACTTCSLAVERSRPNKDGERTTDFFDLVTWRQTAEYMVKNFAKGQTVVIHGELQNRSWTDKFGQKRVTTEVIVDEIYNASGRNRASTPARPQRGGAYEAYHNYAKSQANTGGADDDYAILGEIGDNSEDNA